MSSFYYIAFVIGFTTTAFSQFDKVQADFTTYQTQVRQISTATPQATCQRALSQNFCSNFIKS